MGYCRKYPGIGCSTEGEKKDSTINGDLPGADLIPRYWNLTAGTVGDIVFFGKITIREMIRSWRSHAENLSSHIKSVDEKLKFLEGRDSTAIREIAKRYENPKFPIIGVPSQGSWSKDPEPLDAASINREYGATTFNVCGWCKFTGGGVCRYSYHITTSCTFKTDAGMKDEERRFNTPCFLKKASNETLDSLREGFRKNLNRIIEEKRETDRKIKLLLKLEKLAVKKPALPDYRPYNWFNVNDPVVCFVGSWKERIISDQFVTAKVIYGYRHHDGCVSVCYDKRVHSGPYLEGHGGGYGMSRPEVMHVWEFEYLLEHPEFAGLYAKKGVSSSLEGYDIEQFLLALATEAAKRTRSKKER